MTFSIMDQIRDKLPKSARELWLAANEGGCRVGYHATGNDTFNLRVRRDGLDVTAYWSDGKFVTAEGPDGKLTLRALRALL